MTKDEFLYDHDQDSIIDLLNRHMEFHGAGEEQAETPQTQSNPREFFI